MDFITDNWQIIGAAILLCASEIIGLNPKWQSNSVVQAILALAGKIFQKK